MKRAEAVGLAALERSAKNNTLMEISGFIALFAAIIISRIIMERGYRTLNDEEKIRLMDGFSKTRAYAMIPVFVLIGAYYLLVTKTNIDKGILSIVYFSLLALFVIIRSVLSHKKLSKMKLPRSYNNRYTLAQVVSLIGVAWFFYTIFSKQFGA